MVDIFDKARFSSALVKALAAFTTSEHVKLTCHGYVKGELEFHATLLGTNKRIIIRSTIGKDGLSAKSGNDSIRLWVEYWWEKTNRWHPLKKHETRWTTRAPGWEERLAGKINEMVELAWNDSQLELNPQRTPAEPVKYVPTEKVENTSLPKRDFLKRPSPTISPTIQPVPKPIHKPSTYQKNIYQFVLAGPGHGVVNAVAGSGKTTTNIGCLEYTNQKAKVALVAFNKHIAEEQAQRAPAHVKACTLHSLGYSNIRSGNSYIKVEPYKVHNILRDIQRDSQTSFSVSDLIETHKREIAKLVSLVKNTLTDTSDTCLTLLCDRYGLNFNGDEKGVFDLARRVYTASERQCPHVIDYDDMIELCARGKAGCEKFDLLVVDEAQDLNKAQIEMALRSIYDDGRILATGDRWQSIYGFRGADTNAMPDMINRLGACELPLSITYRCPLAVVEMVNREFPEIDFQARENAREGQVKHIEARQLIENVTEGDLVLCRVNAPLVRPAFELIRQGIKAVILGRDIGQGLNSLVRKTVKQTGADSLLELIRELSEYKAQETTKLVEAGKTGRAQTLEDQVETIFALSDGAGSVHEVQTRIKDMFSDTRAGVTFSSVHKAKGSEANNVFILKPELMPHPKATQEWEAQQERNIKYVAWTRAKDTLTFVKTEEKDKDDEKQQEMHDLRA